MATDRLQKILAHAGVASRRAAEALITAGRVRVNGHVVTELGAKADPRSDKVEVDGKRLVAEEPVYIVLHKPRGAVSTMSDPEGRLSIKDLLTGVVGRVYPIGRLDFATSGVLLATNDGDFAEALMHPRREVPKTYVVKLSGKMSEKDLEKWETGIDLEDGKTLPAKVTLLRYEDGASEATPRRGPNQGQKTWIELTIREGRNQQIRRMGEATGFPVMRLARVSFAGITSENLRPTEWRPLTYDELSQLKKTYGVPKRLPPRGAIEAAARPAARPRRGPDSRRRSPALRQERAAPAGGARYGGGSPGRRDHAVKDDWAGGAGRGRPPAHDSSDSHGRPGEGTRGGLGRSGGRGGATRTTGTGGGIGGQTDASYRISRTRRR